MSEKPYDFRFAFEDIVNRQEALKAYSAALGERMRKFVEHCRPILAHLGEYDASRHRDLWIRQITMDEAVLAYRPYDSSDYHVCVLRLEWLISEEALQAEVEARRALREQKALEEDARMEEEERRRFQALYEQQQEYERLRKKYGDPGDSEGADG